MNYIWQNGWDFSTVLLKRNATVLAMKPMLYIWDRVIPSICYDVLVYPDEMKYVWVVTYLISPANLL